MALQGDEDLITSKEARIFNNIQLMFVFQNTDKSIPDIDEGCQRDIIARFFSQCSEKTTQQRVVFLLYFSASSLSKSTLSAKRLVMGHRWRKEYCHCGKRVDESGGNRLPLFP